MCAEPDSPTIPISGQTPGTGSSSPRRVPFLPVGSPQPRPDFVTGAIDLHIHSGPDVTTRIGTSIDIARAAAACGMAAIVLKDHMFPSWTKAVLTDQAVDGIRVFGGISLNGTSGGIAVRPVAGALEGGCKVVMFPTFDSYRYVHRDKLSRLQLEHAFGQQIEVIRAVDEDGTIRPETEEVLRVVAQRPDTILSSGHLGPEEAVPLMERAAELGIEAKVIEHPNSSDWWSDDDLKRLIACGTVFNLSYNPYQPMMGKRPFAEVVTFIQTYGAQNCTLITDGGQPYNAMPVITLNLFAEMLYASGVAIDDIRTMTHTTPARLLGLEIA